MKKEKFSNKKVKISVEDCYLEDLCRNGVIITVWRKKRLYLRTCSINSNELFQDVQSTLKILSTYIKSPQARRWFRKVMDSE